jgi:hypothetical protein
MEGSGMADRQDQRQGLKGPQRRSGRLVSSEELQWFECRVERVGPGDDGTIWVNLTDTGAAFERVWFVALYSIALQLLDTALVAVQGGLVCQVALTGTTEESEIHNLHVIAASGR